MLRNNGGDDLAITADGRFTFATPLTNGSAYSVTISSQPSGQSCSVSGGSGIVAGGNVTTVAVGCVANTLHHRGDGHRTLRSRAGPPQQRRGRPSGARERDLHLRHGADHRQHVRSDGRESAFRTDLFRLRWFRDGGRQRHHVAVSCVAKQVHDRRNGERSARARPRAPEQRRGRPRRHLKRHLHLRHPLASGNPYAVTVRKQPYGTDLHRLEWLGHRRRGQRHQRLGQLRHQSTYSIGGTVTGLTAAGLVLRNNGGDDLAVGSNGSFTFATWLPAAALMRSLSGPSQPVRPAPSRTARGPCPAPTSPTFGHLRHEPTAEIHHRRHGGGLSGTGLVLRNNGGDDLAVGSNGIFTFATSLTSGSTYAVTSGASPPRRPAPSRMARAPWPAPTSPTSRSLRREQVHHRRDGGRPYRRRARPAEQRRRRPRRRLERQLHLRQSLTSGSTYCGDGRDAAHGSDLHRLEWLGHRRRRQRHQRLSRCVTNTPQIHHRRHGPGLTGGGLVLRNNGGDDLAVGSNGSFTFATSLTSGSTYAVTVATQPTGQTCTVSNGSGTVAGANVTNVSVSCGLRRQSTRRDSSPRTA